MVTTPSTKTRSPGDGAGRHLRRQLFSTWIDRGSSRQRRPGGKMERFHPPRPRLGGPVPRGDGGGGGGGGLASPPTVSRRRLGSVALGAPSSSAIGASAASRRSVTVSTRSSRAETSSRSRSPRLRTPRGTAPLASQSLRSAMYAVSRARRAVRSAMCDEPSSRAFWARSQTPPSSVLTGLSLVQGPSARPSARA